MPNNKSQMNRRRLRIPGAVGCFWTSPKRKRGGASLGGPTCLQVGFVESYVLGARGCLQPRFF